MQTVKTAYCCVTPECRTPLVREPISEPAADELARVFKALADPVRLRLVSLIGAHAGGEVCVCDLTAAFDLTQPTISHHLRVLREAGLIDSERRGTWVYYRILPAALDRIAGLLAVSVSQPPTDPRPPTWPGPRAPPKPPSFPQAEHFPQALGDDPVGRADAAPSRLRRPVRHGAARRRGRRLRDHGQPAIPWPARPGTAGEFSRYRTGPVGDHPDARASVRRVSTR